MKKLEKTVHFKVEGTSIGCYDSSGFPVEYLMVSGEPFIKLDSSVNRLLDIQHAMVHTEKLQYYRNHGEDQFASVELKAVVNGRFISDGCTSHNYAERQCTKRELASFYLAMYKAYKNSIKLEEHK